MSEEKFREWISSEFEKEAEELEKRLQEHEAADPELAALEMPEDSFDDLMRRIKAEEENKNISKNENGPAKKPFRIRKRTLLAVAAAAILVAAMGAGVTGAKLFVPKVENRSEDGIQRLLMERWKKTGTFQRKMPIRKLRTDWGFRRSG